MEQLFTDLTHVIEGSAAMALSAAFLWGILSILLSPCHLASIPLIIGLIDEQEPLSARRAFAASLLFSIGILLSIALIGLITATAGRILGDIGRYAAIIFFVMGLQLLGVLSSPWNKPEQKASAKKGLMTAILTGLVFGIALGPCTFAFMAPVLAMTFKLSSEAPIFAWSLVLLYGIGHCAVLVAAGTSARMIEQYLNWNAESKGAMRLRKACGFLVILAGLYILYTTG